ncbi:MAG: radical SAM protein [Thermoplasmata archaeon]|nr:radical SAM protein [Thermoplasmata archaeon]
MNIAENIQDLRDKELAWLLDKAWSLRTVEFPNELVVSAPGAKTYITDHHRNKRHTFVNISVTGNDCALNCEHCKGSLLDSMNNASDPQELIELGDRLIAKGCEGILISGGADKNGEVLLSGFTEAIAYLKGIGLKVLVHSGLASRESAISLKNAGVDQVLLDIIGSDSTIKEVYHLDKTTSDYSNTLSYLADEGLEIVPHILIGLHFGQMVGEYDALEMIMNSRASHIVFVVLMPKEGTPMENVTTPSAQEIARLIAIARILNPQAKITLGCARPPGEEKLATEEYAIKAGVNGIAYPTDQTMELAGEKGLKLIFRDTCCSLL